MTQPSSPRAGFAQRVASSRLLRGLDLVSGLCARTGDVLLVAITAMLAWEVIARYILLSPTRWTHDVSTTMMIWFTYLSMALVLRDRQMIRITALVGLAGPMLRRLAEAFSLVVIAAFCAIAVTFAWDMMMQSIAMGRRQPTMLRMPNWIAELPVVLGFSLLFLQALADLIRLPFRPAPEFSPTGEHAPDDLPKVPGQEGRQ